jgi:SRSO17 transposase
MSSAKAKEGMMADDVTRSERFDEYLNLLVGVMGHEDRQEPLRKYCTGLFIPGKNKSVEPMAARLSPSRVSAEHQSLLHFVGQATWSDEAVLGVAGEYALPFVKAHGPVEAWILDDTGMPKKGEHSVGVANQYCGVLGKNHNCQVTVSLSLANESASVPAAHRLYLPESWANDLERRRKAKVPDDVAFARKWEIGLTLIDQVLSRDPKVPRGVVLADPGYGDCFDFRQGVTERGLKYVVGVAKNTVVWPPGKSPQPPPPYSGMGRPPEGLRRTKEHYPITAHELALSLPKDAFRPVTWREGTKGSKTSRFAAVRVRPARRKGRYDLLLPEEWLLIEWPDGENEPTKYWLSTEDEGISLEELARKAKLRWRIERDYQELKQEVGFGDYQGRGWLGFHHHITLSIAAYAFLLAERARLSPPDARAESPVELPPVPRGFRPRGSPDPS